MLIRWYQKTYEFNEELPIKSMHLMKFAFLMHFLCGGYQLSKSNILQEDDVHQNHFFFQTKFEDL